MADATLALSIVLNDGASSGLGALGLAFMGLGKTISDIALIQMSNLSDSMKGVGTAAVITGDVFQALAGFVGDTIQAASDLQTEMNYVSITVNGAADAGNALTDSLVHTADTSIFTTAQVADAFSQLGIDGWTATQIMNGLGQTTIDFAEAAKTQTVPAALLLGSAMKMFGATADQATRYANDLTFAMYNGQKNATNLQQAIAQVGPIASIAGVNFDELAIALAYMGEQGFVGSRAGTALRYMLAGLTSPTKQAAKEMKDLGLAVLDAQDNVTSSKFFDDQGHFIGIAKSIDVLHGALQNLNPMQQMEALKNLFSVRGGQGAELFLKDYSKWVSALGNLQGIENATSVTAKAEQVTNTYGGALTRVMTTFNDFKAMLGNADLGPLKGIFNELAADMDKFNIGSDQLHTTITIILLAVTALAGLAFAVTATIFVFGVLGTALSAAVPIVGGIVLAIGLVVAAITSMNWLWQQASDKTSQFYGVAKPIFDFLGNAWRTIQAQIQPLLSSLGDLGLNLNTLKIIGIALFAMFIVPLVAAILVVVGVIVVVVVAFTKLVQAVDWVKQRIGDLLGVLGNFFSSIPGWANQAFTAVTNAIHNGLTAASNFVTSLLNGIKSAILGGFTWIKDTVQNAINAVVGIFSWLYNHNYYFKDLVDLIKYDFNTAKTIILAIWTDITGWLTNTWNGIKLVVSLIFNNIKTTIQNDINAVKLVVTTVVGAIESVWNTVWTHVRDAVSSAWNFIVGQFNAGKARVEGPLIGIRDFITSLVSQIATTLFNAGKNLIDMLIKGITSKLGDLKSTLGNVAGQIASFLGFHSPTKEGPGSTADQWAPNLMRMFAGGITSNVGLVRSAVQGVASTLNPSNPMYLTHAASLAASPASGYAGTQTINVCVDGKVVAQVVKDNLRGTLQQNGGGRLFR